jgi:hypothetical protein
MLQSSSASLIGRGILAIIVGIVAVAWPGVTVLALILLFAVYAFIDAGLELMRTFSLIFGVSEIMLGYELRHSGGSLRTVMQDAALR